MAIGFGLLSLEPRAFWSMTLSEMDAAVRGRFGAVQGEHPPSRRDLTELTKRFPDS